MKDIKTKGANRHKSRKGSSLASKMRQGLIHSKDRTKNLADDGKFTPDEYAQDNIKYMIEDSAEDTLRASGGAIKKSYRGGKDALDRIKQRRIDTRNIKQKRTSAGNKTIKTLERDIKTAGKTAAKTTERSVRASIKTAEKSVKTAEKTAKAAKKTAEASAKATRKAAETARAAAKATAKAAQVAARAVVAAVKAMVAAVKELAALIAEGGWVAVVVIVLIAMVALIVGSGFGLFYSDLESGEAHEYTIKNAVAEISEEYENELTGIQANVRHDVFELTGYHAPWQDVLAVFSVKTSGDPKNPQEVVTMDGGKKTILRMVFWDMTHIEFKTEEKEDVVTREIVDDKGVKTTVSETVKRTHLYITVTRKSADEIAAEYGFTKAQTDQLHEMLSEKNKEMWDSLLSGVPK